MTSPDIWISISTDYVRPRPPGERDAWTEEAAQQGQVGSQVLRDVSEVVPPTDVAEALGLHPAELAVARRRLVLLGVQPVELADSYYPLSVAAGSPLAEFRKIRGGAVTLLAELGHPPRTVREDVSTRMPNADERALLDLGDNHPVLVLFRLMLGDGNRPVEATVMTMADGRHLQYELAV